MDYYSILNVKLTATRDEIKNAYKNNKNSKTKEAYKVLKDKDLRDQYNLKLLEYYRNKNNTNLFGNNLFQNFLKFPNNIFNNLENDLSKNSKSYAVISTTTGKNGKYVTSQSTRVNDGKTTKISNKTIEVDKYGNKVIKDEGDNLFKKKIKINNLLEF